MLPSPPKLEKAPVGVGGATASKTYRRWGFDSLTDYAESWRGALSLFATRCGHRVAVDDLGADETEGEGTGTLAKTLGPVSLTLMGVGIVVGAGEP